MPPTLGEIALFDLTEKIIMQDYEDLLSNFSPEMKPIVQQMLEVMRIDVFGGDQDEYGQKVFREKYLRALKNARPQEPNFGTNRLQEIQRVLKANPVHSDVSVVKNVRTLVCDLETELRQRAEAIQGFNSFFNDLLHSSRGAMPLQEAFRYLQAIKSHSLRIILQNDDEISRINREQEQDSNVLWQRVHLAFNEVVSQMFLVVFYEIIFPHIQKAESSSERTKDILFSLWTEMSLLLNDALIHFVYVEGRPVSFAKEPNERVTKDRTTRVKVFFSKAQMIFQLRLDVAHEGENYFHANIETMFGEPTDPSIPHTYQFSDIPNQNNADEELVHILAEIETALRSIYFANRNKMLQERNEMDEQVMRLVFIQILKKNFVDLMLQEGMLPEEWKSLAIEVIKQYEGAFDKDYEEIALVDDTFLIDCIENIEATILEKL